MNTFHETYLASSQGQNHGRCTRAFSKEAYAFHQRAVGNAGGGEDQLFARCEIFSLVDAIFVFDAHTGQTLVLVGFHDEAAEHVSIEAANGGGSDHAFRSPA